MNVRPWMVLVAGGVLAGCTSVKLVQRDACWVRQTQKWPMPVTEEIGPCARGQPAWATDRLARLTQECVTQADFRWYNRALSAWSRGEPIPPLDSESALIESCMAKAAQALEIEKESLKARLADVNADRDRLRMGNQRLTDALGEAAKKPAGTATATATARGDGNSASDTATSIPALGPQVLAGPAQLVPSAPSAVPATKVPPSSGVAKTAATAAPKRCPPSNLDRDRGSGVSNP